MLFQNNIDMRAKYSSVVVYLGSSSGMGEKYKNDAYNLGKALAQMGTTLIYGGACVGTMGALAQGALEAGGKVVGVFPEGFKGKKENSLRGINVRATNLTELIATPSIAARVEKMTQLSQAAIILPGSFGTMHEFFAYALELQLGLHSKPIFVLNTDGFYDPIKSLISNMIVCGFMSSDEQGLVRFCDTVEELVAELGVMEDRDL